MPIRRAIPALSACAAFLVAAGCGSSSPSTSSSSSPRSSTASAPSSRLRPTTTPKFAAPPSSAAVRSGVVQISYRNITIQPDAIKVKVQSTIKWTSYDSVEHNVTSEGGSQKFASKNFGEGASFEIKASKPGVIHYECTIHPASMNGTIEVVN